MNPTPDPGLIRNLAALDKDLRLRWGIHQQVWLLELQVKERNPAWLAEKPSPLSPTPRGRDAWDSWRLGRIFVTKFKHPIRFPWEFLAAHLKHLSLEAHLAKDALLERLDAAEREEEAAVKRKWATANEAGAKTLYDDFAWEQGRRVSLNQPGPSAKEEPREGYVVRDRRVTA